MMAGGLFAGSFRDRGDYAGACGTMRAIEKRLLDDDRLEELLEAASVGEMQALLERWGWMPHGAGEKGLSLEQSLMSALKATDRELLALDPEPDVTLLLIMKYEMQNVAALLKAKSVSAGFTDDLHPRGLSERRALEEMSARGRFGHYPAPLAVKLERLQQRLAEGDAGEVGDVVFRTWSEALLEAAVAAKSDLLTDYLRHRRDLDNIRRKVRALRHPVMWEGLGPLPGGLVEESIIFAAGSVDDLRRRLSKTVYGDLLGRSVGPGGGLSARLLERAADDFLTGIMEPAKFVSLGPESLWGFYHGREIDAANIRAAAVKLATGEKTGELKTVLRRPYV